MTQKAMIFTTMYNDAAEIENTLQVLGIDYDVVILDHSKEAMDFLMDQDSCKGLPQVFIGETCITEMTDSQIMKVFNKYDSV
jgi:glutaredoxin